MFVSVLPETIAPIRSWKSSVFREIVTSPWLKSASIPVPPLIDCTAKSETSTQSVPVRVLFNTCPSVPGEFKESFMAPSTLRSPSILKSPSVFTCSPSSLPTPSVKILSVAPTSRLSIAFTID